METMHTVGIVLATHPLQIALPAVALYHALRTAVREYSAHRALRRRLVIVGAASRRASAVAA